MTIQEAKPKIATPASLSECFEKSPGSVEAMDGLVVFLKEARSQLGPEGWKTFCSDFKTNNPSIWETLLSCPMTRHSNTRPRGYPGDAELIDYIYSKNAGEAVSNLGHKVFDYTVNSKAGQAVRARRDILAQYIDSILATEKPSRTLSLACGHLREAALSRAVQEGRAEIVAMDQDAQSIEEVSRSCQGLKIQAQTGSVRGWLKGEYRPLPPFDLAYACGLYDYLPDPVAIALSAKLFDALNTGGILLVPNFLPDVDDIGYLECCMDWWLIYRNEKDMHRLLDGIPPSAIASTRTFIEPANNIIFMEVRKA